MEALKKEMMTMRIDPSNPYMKDLATLLENPADKLVVYYRELIPKLDGILKKNALQILSLLEKKKSSDSI